MNLCYLKANDIWPCGKGLTNCISNQKHVTIQESNQNKIKKNQQKRFNFVTKFIYIPLIKVGPKFNIVSFNTMPNLCCELYSLVSESAFDVFDFIIPDILILIAAEAKEPKTFQNRISKLWEYVRIMWDKVIRVRIYFNESKGYYMRSAFEIVISFLCIVSFWKWFCPHFREMVIIDYLFFHGFKVSHDEICGREFCKADGLMLT